MTVDELVLRYPLLYHMANANSWESISHLGLLSTTALLDLFEIRGNERYRIESCHRPKSVEIHHPRYGTVTIRDQAPMRESQLERCLVGIGCREWYELLNRQAFLWATEARVLSLLNARLYRNVQHTVITVDAASLLARHGDRTSLSPLNSGSTLYNPPPRGRFTFCPIAEYRLEEHRGAIAEIAVDYAVPDLLDHAVTVQTRRGGEVLDTLYSRSAVVSPRA